MTELSSRAAALAGHASPLVEAHFRIAGDPWHPDDNPDGYINFGTAENFLLWDQVGERLNTAPPLTEHDVHYAELHGRHDARAALARQMTATHGAAFDPDQLVLVSGASSALDILATLICEPGDSVAVAAPYYSGFDGDLGARAGARILPVALDPADRFSHDVDATAAAIDEAIGRGERVRALLLSSPHNPTGRCIPESTLRGLIRMARKRDLHVIVDELYAGSVFGDAKFTSARALAPDDPAVHCVYGLAKDFGLSGLKVGVLHSLDERLLSGARQLAQLAPVSTATQQRVIHLLSDAQWCEQLLEINRSRLAVACAALCDGVAAFGVPVLRPDAAVFAWLDLRAWLDASTREAEMALFSNLLDAGRVNLSPGSAFHCTEPGWFRLCYAQDSARVEAGLERLGRVLLNR